MKHKVVIGAWIALGLVAFHSGEAKSLFECDRALSVQQKKVCEKYQEAVYEPLSLGLMDNISSLANELSGNLFALRSMGALVGNVYAQSMGETQGGFPDIKGIHYLKIRLKRRLDSESGRVRFAFRVIGEPTSLGLVRQIRLANLTNGEPILDKVGKVGEYEEEVDPNDGTNTFSFYQDWKETPPQDGAYKLLIETTQGISVEKTIVLKGLAPTAAPQVTVRMANEKIPLKNPVFEFENFRSPQYRDFEKRKLDLVVTQCTESCKDLYHVQKQSPNVTRIVFGDQTLGMGQAELSPGQYRVQIGFRERTQMGSLAIERESATYVPFTIE